MTKEVYLIKAFTQDPEQGNPAGVIFDADDLEDRQMIQIAAELGFSESAFVSKSEHADFKVRFFSPKQEVPLCGHATIATFHTIFESKRAAIDKEGFVQLTQETLAGILPVRINSDGLITMTQTSPVFYEGSHDKKEIADLLGMSAEDILDFPIELVSTGSPKLMIPIKNLDSLFAIKPNLEGISKYCSESEVHGFYPLTTETKDGNSDFHARQFNPLAGITEDPITGAAAGALGAYSVKHKVLGDKKSFVVEQGYILSKGGKVYVEIGDNVEVGGFAVSFGKKEITV